MNVCLFAKTAGSRFLTTQTVTALPSLRFRALNRPAVNVAQDKELTVSYITTSAHSTHDHHHYQHHHHHHDPLFLIPVLNHPLSSNRYYAIAPHGKRIGEAFTCSREEDMDTCCFSRCINDEKPRALDPSNIYQQFEIIPYDRLVSARGDFEANSIASDGFPPDFLPELDSTASRISVGKWYTPFIFVKEGTLRDQVERAMYYEQRWDRIFSCRRNDHDHHNQGNSVVIDTTL